MKIINISKIPGGNKNQTFKLTKKNNKHIFLKKKDLDGFNHVIEYNLLNKFDFVPNLIKNKKTEITWEFLDGKKPKLNNDNLKKIAKILKKLHNSKVKFPKENHRERLLKYFDDLKDKKNLPKEIKKYFNKSVEICDSLQNNVPLHNDVWINNFLDVKTKIYLIDWEFATMGDIHFDLAFFIDGSHLNKQQEEQFLKHYGQYDKATLIKSKFLVNYLTLLWLYRFASTPFSADYLIYKLNNSILNFDF